MDFLPKVKIEIVINEDRQDAAVEAIQKAARTGRIGDGKIFVLNVEEAIRIRTGETGSDANLIAVAPAGAGATIQPERRREPERPTRSQR